MIFRGLSAWQPYSKVFTQCQTHSSPGASSDHGQRQQNTVHIGCSKKVIDYKTLQGFISKTDLREPTSLATSSDLLICDWLDRRHLSLEHRLLIQKPHASLPHEHKQSLNCFQRKPPSIERLIISRKGIKIIFYSIKMAKSCPWKTYTG
jgi:hypothetical protein